MLHKNINCVKGSIILEKKSKNRTKIYHFTVFTAYSLCSTDCSKHRGGAGNKTDEVSALLGINKVTKKKKKSDCGVPVMVQWKQIRLGTGGCRFNLWPRSVG